MNVSDKTIIEAKKNSRDFFFGGILFPRLSLSCWDTIISPQEKEGLGVCNLHENHMGQNNSGHSQ